MSSTLSEVFDLREGEIKKALLMQVVIFLIISTLLIVKPTVNGLFLAKFGVEQLPYAFILVAISAAIVSYLYSRLLFRVNMYRIFRYTIQLSVVSLLLFGIFLRLNLAENIVLYVFYIWVAIFALLTTSQFWILANMVFDSRQAKRIFSFIGAGAIAGGIFGGYLTSILSNHISAEYLTGVSAFILAPVLFLSHEIWENYLKSDVRILTAISQTKYDSKQPYKLILESRHLTLIAAIVAISVMVAKLVDYQFGGLASDIIQDPDELTAFFGFWFSTFNVISLFLQLFMTRRIVGHYGVASTIFILPATIFMASMVIFLFPGLLFGVVLLKMSDGGLKQSINKAAMELLIFPVSTEIKNRTKTFIDVFVDSLATGFIGLLLIFIIKGMGMSYMAVNIMLVILIVLWIYFAFLVRKEYVKTISAKLRKLNETNRQENIDYNKSSVIETIQQVLKSGTDEQKLFMLKKIRPLADRRFQSALVALLDDPSAKIRAEALINALAYHDPVIKQKAMALANDETQMVKVRAIEYLVRHEPYNQQFIHGYLNHSDVKIWSAALVGLAWHIRAVPHSIWRHELNRQIRSTLIKLSNEKEISRKKHITITLLKAIGYGRLTEFYSFIDALFEDSDSSIRQSAISAAGYTRSEFLFDSMIRIIQKGPGSDTPAIENALAAYDGYFLTLLKDQELGQDLSVVAFLPGILRKIPRQSSVDYLFTLLSHKNSRIRSDTVRALNYLKNNHDHLWFDAAVIANELKKLVTGYMDMLTILYAQSNNTISGSTEEFKARKDLVELLEARLDQRLEVIFRLLGLQYPPEDIMSVYSGITAKQKEYRASAVEMLDNILDRDMRKVLIPLVESTMLEELNNDIIKRLKLSVPDEKHCFRYLLEFGDERLALAVLHLLESEGHHFMLEMTSVAAMHYSEKVREKSVQLASISL